jgi:hypothetical protein
MSVYAFGLNSTTDVYAYVATSEVTTLEHELWDDAVEGRAGITEALLASAESAEVLSGLWDNVVVEVEVDAAGLLWRGKLAHIDNVTVGFPFPKLIVATVSNSFVAIKLQKVSQHQSIDDWSAL